MNTKKLVFSIALPVVVVFTAKGIHTVIVETIEHTKKTRKETHDERGKSNNGN